MDRIVQILQKEYDRLEYAMKLGKSIGKENAPEYKQLEIELAETDEAIKILTTNADTGEKQCNLPVVMRCTCCGNTTKFSDGAKQQILIEEEYRYIYAVTCDECGKVCDVELFD